MAAATPPSDVRELAPDVLRHRIVPSFTALAEQVSADMILERLIGAVPVPQWRVRRSPRGLLAAPRTADRPGPGPTPEVLIRALDLSVGRRIRGLVPGQHRASDLGVVVELAQVRPYEPGDDVRRIDWNVTARTTIPHVRVFVPERALTTWLLLDVSPSMTFGTADRRKADVAEGVAIAVGHLATQRGNRLGLVTFGGGSDRRLPPTAWGARDSASLVAARAAGDAALPAEHAGARRRLLVPSRPPRRSASSRAFRHVAGCLSSSPICAARATRQAPLAAASTKHHVLVVEIRDPREDVLPDVGDLTLVDGETGREVRVHTSSRQLRERFAAAAADERAGLETTLRRLGVDHVVLSTSGNWLLALATCLRVLGRAA